MHCWKATFKKNKALLLHSFISQALLLEHRIKQPSKNCFYLFASQGALCPHTTHPPSLSLIRKSKVVNKPQFHACQTSLRQVETENFQHQYSGTKGTRKEAFNVFLSFTSCQISKGEYRMNVLGIGKCVGQHAWVLSHPPTHSPPTQFLLGLSERESTLMPPFFPLHWICVVSSKKKC